MDGINRSNDEPSATSGGLNRRAVLMTAAVVAAANFGAPLVELHFPANLLTLEQKAAMINGVTHAVLTAKKQRLDPARKSFVQLFETADGGFGVNGQVFVPRGK
jgi:hypothetical protein